MNRNGFCFGIEAEFLLVDANSYQPLWYRNLESRRCARRLTLFQWTMSNRKPSPYIVEGYHLTDKEMNPIDLLPKGVEIRTPVCVRLRIALPHSRRCTRAYSVRSRNWVTGPPRSRSIRRKSISKVRKRKPKN
jgi:hypothetical protein